MQEILKAFTIGSSTNVLEALQKIDQNKKGFLVVIDENDKALGTITDGDIRRAFISGIDLSSNIEAIYRSDFTCLKMDDGLSKAIDLFKDMRFKFLPVIDNDGKLVNLITRNQLHSLLLQDIHADLNYDFTSLDESIVDHEIFQRPWGFYKTTVMNNYFQAKVICVYPGQQLSLQSHNHREEYWIVAHGEGKVQLGESIVSATSGRTFFIPKGCKHRLMNTGETENLIITELQLGDYFGEDDIVRYEDIYGRD